MIIYNQQTGLITRNNACLGIGYSGHGEGVNNPLFETVRAVGPIPRGIWRMSMPYNHPRLGRYAIPLTVIAGEFHKSTIDGKEYERAGFFVHGDNNKADQSASLGCIIAAYKLRVQMWTTSEDKLITVI